MPQTAALKPKRNFYVSYLKGYAILSIALIHLIDWSGLRLTLTQAYLKELLYPGVLFFIALAGSLIYIAYGKYDLRTAAKKSFRRGGELILVYYLYSIIKFYIFNFSTEPFYERFIGAGQFNLLNILTLQTFTVPIGIILTIGIFIIISPLWLYLSKIKFAKLIFPAIILALAAANYYLPSSAGPLADFLYAKNNIMFPPALWLLPYLIGFYLAMLGLEKYKGRLLIFFAALTAACAWLIFNVHNSLKLTDYMYPLKLYYLLFSFAFMYVLIYLFNFLEKIKNNAVNYLLSVLRLLGDTTLAIYIYHWLVIDLTLWLFYPREVFIRFSVPLFLLAYLAAKRKKILEYYKNY